MNRKFQHSHPMRLQAFLVLLLMAGISLSVGAQDELPTRALESIDSASLPGNRAQLILMLSEDAPEPEVFTVDKPARLSLDLPQTRLLASNRYQEINVGPVRAVAMAEAQGKTRVVIELTQLTPYEVEQIGNELKITFGEKSNTLASLPANPPAAAPLGSADFAPSPAPREASKQIELIDFRRGENGEGRVIINMSDEHASIDVRQEGGKVIAEFMNIGINDRMLRRLDVLDFATPVQYIDARRSNGNTQVVITPVSNGYFEQVAYQSEKTFTVELQPLTQAEIKKREVEDPTFSGERISLSFQSVDVRSVIQIIADVADTNIVADDSVQGEMSLRLDNVPWDQALDIILQSKGLDKYEEGDVIFIDTLEHVSEREAARSQVQEERQKAAPLSLELFQINYAKAIEIGELLQNEEGASSDDGLDTGFLSKRGTITVDERTNTLLIQDTRERLEDLRRLITSLDVPVRQVLIESRVVIANDNFARDLGARFGVTALKATSNHFITTTGSTGATPGEDSDGASSGSGTDSMVNDFLDSGLPVGLPSADDRFNVNLPVANPAGRIALAVLGADYLIDLELQAMQAEGQGEILSNPRVVTTDRKEASIKSGFQIPVVVDGGGQGPATVRFVDALLRLTVTPSITPERDIIMDLVVTKDEPDFARAVLGIPPINKREVQSQVLVQNGETVVLGGVFEATKSQNVTKVPLLGDLPIIGNLFKVTNKSNTKQELLIFVTPKVLTESLQLTTQ